MKKILFFLAFSLFFITPVFAVEQIDSYEVDVKVEVGGGMLVRERIAYDFGDDFRHGIYRDIPYLYKKGWSRHTLTLENITVTDGLGNKYPFILKRTAGNLRVKIGDPDVLIKGERTYFVSYTVKGAAEALEGYDQINWNSVPTGWSVPIADATVNVTMDKALRGRILAVKCFVGPLGSTESCKNGSGGEAAYIFGAQDLAPHEGLTTKIEFQSGTFPPLSISEKFLSVLRVFWPGAITVLFFFYLFFRWKKHGKDPSGRGTIVTQFEEPANLTPAEVGALVDEKVHGKDISAEIIYLATQGYIRIVKVDKQGLFGSESYVLEKLKSEEGLKNEFDRLLMKHLFANGRQSTSEKSDVLSSVDIKELKNKFSSHFASITQNIYTTLVEKKYFPRDPESIKIIYRVLGVVIVVADFVLLGWAIDAAQVPLVIALAVCAALLFIFAPLMSVKTRTGVDAYEHILGLKNYLSVAEKDRLKFHNAPEKSPKVFERLLPFAMVLGVEQQWAGQFEGIYNQNPDWYVSNSPGLFRPIRLTNSLTGFSSFAKSSLSSTPGSKGGGGGFSGGGFGGGGGGSW